MVFHHEENPEALLRELGRVLQSGGRLFLRDHDSATPEHRMFCLALDTLYYTVFNDHSKIPVPGNYQSMQTWLAIAEDAGFILLSSTFPEPDNPNRPFHAMFTKV
jgi:SAM-dependent methyltransferase